MITSDQYFGKPHSAQHFADAVDLLQRVNRLGDEAQAFGAFTWSVDLDTGSQISGRAGGDGDGGFRTPSATTGDSGSSHRQAKGVDIYDPSNKLDTWLDGFEDGHGGNSKLEERGLYREDPKATNTWCHLTTRAPHSGKRTFQP
jgi:hypothetical protein